ncbi:aminotransferase class I/II-fold pyridoxal phosphate-dependent enzyme [Ruminiclostridium cellulolyticum]|uniref:Pyridoxal-dependent decarboxylase n=1 Tax=Ruminiclostridium cellulolyticum (strain ATCC 35319 / DSM 5812 / JCM 6584 / H10) TaxID=394503 RepID=B8I9E1_RUMCH|nr:aminotransferase class I/II-fold pyridoxal phosphate-dependent enzyme [Ruminiclostridium cellulolyticum]ACL75401.1 Pyridoxal-dependent decarboxylase [Ruminiclostridium cellulolyticum H10]
MEDQRWNFPRNGLSMDQIKEYMNPGRNYDCLDNGKVFLGYPQTTPHPIAIKTYKNYLQYNDNHVGTFSNNNTDLNISRKMEKQFIEMLGDLYGDIEADGYVTSGGTEGNIMGIWVGKYYLGGGETDNLCLIKTYLTHQSIDKACSLNNITNIIEIPYNQNFEMDTNLLRNEIDFQIESGKNRIIIVATVGYTMTGTSDPIDEIDKIIQDYSRNKDVSFYLHVDAAIGGLVYPFCKKEDFAFQYPSVKSLTVDPHKMGYVPFSAGVFLCRRNLQDCVAIPIKYAKTVMDKTLVSSRSAAAAAACWTTFNYLGIAGFEKKIKKLISIKEYLVEKVLADKLAVLISDPGTNMVCLYFDSLAQGLLPEWIEKKYTLDGFLLKCKDEMIICYKVYIMPHVTKRAILQFVDDIRALAC